VWLEKNGQPASFWHDVPLYPDEKDKRIINFVVEVPRWEDAKIEIRRQEPLSADNSVASPILWLI
jgi:inorganic pyrophosphatase